MDEFAVVIPAFRYRDANRAVDWLCEAFGFVPHNVFRDERGDVQHAQLVLPDGAGKGMVMVSPYRDGEDPALGPRGNTLVVTTDCDAHHDRAVAAGAEVEVPLCDLFGGRFYAVKDFEGHCWSFGSYNPWLPIEG